MISPSMEPLPLIAVVAFLLLADIALTALAVWSLRRRKNCLTCTHSPKSEQTPRQGYTIRAMPDHVQSQEPAGAVLFPPSEEARMERLYQQKKKHLANEALTLQIEESEDV